MYTALSEEQKDALAATPRLAHDVYVETKAARAQQTQATKRSFTSVTAELEEAHDALASALAKAQKYKARACRRKERLGGAASTTSEDDGSPTSP